MSPVRPLTPMKPRLNDDLRFVVGVLLALAVLATFLLSIRLFS